MKNVNTIKSELAAVRQTRQITNAMYLLSVARARSGLSKIAALNAYSESFDELIRTIPGRSALSHPLAKKSECKKTALIVIGGDKGLCGGYNNDVAAELIAKKAELADNLSALFVFGKKEAEILRAKGIKDFTELSAPARFPTGAFASELYKKFFAILESGEIDSLKIIYTHYINAAVHEVRTKDIFPVSIDQTGTETAGGFEPIYEPDRESVLETALTGHAKNAILSCFCNAFTSENIARMNAMQSATDNADEMAEKYSAQFNAARQLAITSELVEIASATTLFENSI